MARGKVTISVFSPILPGTLVSTMATCGKPNCACSSDPAKLHGPYYRWTGIIKGKRTTIALSHTLYRECRRRNARYKKLLQQFDNVMEHALENAPWVTNSSSKSR